MSHQDRREPLPKGYQFGDAGRSAIHGEILRRGHSRPVADAWDTYYRTVRHDEPAGRLSAMTPPPTGPGADYGTFVLGRYVCKTCWTTGKYDCPTCGVLNRLTEMEDEQARDLMEANGITREGQEL